MANSVRLKHLQGLPTHILILAVGGCMPQEEASSPKSSKHTIKSISSSAPTIIHRIVGDAWIIAAMQTHKTKIVEVESGEGDIVEADRAIRAHHARTRPGSTLCTGCDEFCTYCIVPYTRGEEAVVANRRTIFAEIEQLIDRRRTSEVTLLGQNVNSYGLTSDQKTLTRFRRSARSSACILNRSTASASQPRHPKDFHRRPNRASIAKGGNLDALHPSTRTIRVRSRC
ncbi:MAG: hypothetical protein MZU97_04330 [Bacillus subtilis]|nr:hypothetical protein [Bacillus subtilis]